MMTNHSWGTREVFGLVGHLRRRRSGGLAGHRGRPHRGVTGGSHGASERRRVTSLFRWSGSGSRWSCTGGGWRHNLGARSQHRLKEQKAKQWMTSVHNGGSQSPLKEATITIQSMLSKSLISNWEATTTVRNSAIDDDNIGWNLRNRNYIICKHSAFARITQHWILGKLGFGFERVLEPCSWKEFEIDLRWMVAFEASKEACQ